MKFKKTVKEITKILKTFMHQLFDATFMSKKEYFDPISEIFRVKSKFPHFFTFFKFQLVQAFTFFPTAKLFFSFFRQRKYSEKINYCCDWRPWGSELWKNRQGEKMLVLQRSSKFRLFCSLVPLSTHMFEPTLTLTWW